MLPIQSQPVSGRSLITPPARPTQAPQTAPQTAPAPLPPTGNTRRSEPLDSHLPGLEQAVDGSSSTQLRQRSERLAGVTPSALSQAREGLRPVSQQAVLRLGELDETVLGSGQTLVARTERSGFDRDRLPSSQGTLTIVAHGDDRTIGGKSPQALAQYLKAQGITQLGRIELTSCGSQALVQSLGAALAEAGIQVGQIVGYHGEIGVELASGKVLPQQPGVRTSGALGGGQSSGLIQTDPDVVVPKPRIEGVEAWRDLPLKMRTAGTDVIDAAIKEGIPKKVAKAFESGDEASVIGQLIKHEWVQATLLEAVYRGDRAVMGSGLDRMDYQPNTFGVTGACSQTSFMAKYLIDSLVTHLGSEQQQGLKERVYYHGNSGHSWLEVRPEQGSKMVIDPTWKQYQIKASEAQIVAIKVSEGLPTMPMLSKESQKHVKSLPMIFYGTVEQHEPLKKNLLG